MSTPKIEVRNFSSAKHHQTRGGFVVFGCGNRSIRYFWPSTNANGERFRVVKYFILRCVLSKLAFTFFCSPAQYPKWIRFFFFPDFRTHRRSRAARFYNFVVNMSLCHATRLQLIHYRSSKTISEVYEHLKYVDLCAWEDHSMYRLGVWSVFNLKRVRRGPLGISKLYAQESWFVHCNHYAIDTVQVFV